MSIEPVQAFDRFRPVVGNAGGTVEQEVTPGHHSLALGGVEGPDPDQRPDVDRRLPDDLLQNTFGQKISERARPERARQTVERLVASVPIGLDPALPSPCLQEPDRLHSLQRSQGPDPMLQAL